MIKQDCICPKKNCPRNGKCDECVKFHSEKGKLSYCRRKKPSLFGFLKKH